MSRIIIDVERSSGLLHMVQTEDGSCYWVSSIHGEMPLAAKPETIVVKCRANGEVSKPEWQKPRLQKTFRTIEESEVFHRQILESLESVL